MNKSLQTKILRRTTSSEEYSVYMAGLERDLVEPIVIESRDDLKSTSKWQSLLTPFHHQVTNLITFCRRLPVTLLADDVGLGKTISAGLIISELMTRSRLTKILIVCPKLLGPQWKEELETKFNISARVLTGKDLLGDEGDDVAAVITTYQSASLYLDKIRPDQFQMLILDEAHKLRNLYGTPKAPKVATQFRLALEARRFRYVLMLTATPIHNRLWDLYSLVDLLTVARGHKNPFGSEEMFIKKFIGDGRAKSRILRPEAKDEFRSIVYGYMSRVRRDDAKLYFPTRKVQMHQVDPSQGEIKLIQTLAEPIQKLNRLAQISILQALTSSPEALLAQLENMARNGTVTQNLFVEVKDIVLHMGRSAKLTGLASLIAKLKQENPEKWRLVVFTSRLETQTSICAYLEELDIKVGVINGASGARNQATLERFRKTPHECRVIVSTEAGSEGINLQIANVLANYDLPWNPAIVEQRIGRIQRLASEHANVSIFNIMLRGTFEEYIVGRLMEKLQMASHAIGDIESLLVASGIGGEDDDASSFDELIRQLVVAALANKDVEKDTQLKEESIANAKLELEREETSINEMLGGMGGAEHQGPRAPNLPQQEHSMQPIDFTLASFNSFGANVHEAGSDNYFVEEQGGGRETIRFDEKTKSDSTLYAPGSPAFQRLVSRVVARSVCLVNDADGDILQHATPAVEKWAQSFGGLLKPLIITNTTKCFTGKAVIRVRASVAHDSYERLVEVGCSPVVHRTTVGKPGLHLLPQIVEAVSTLGINLAELENAVSLDTPIAEFRRFYLERRKAELDAAGTDERKRDKLDKEFTPQLEMTLVSLKGDVHRELECLAQYTIGPQIYESSLMVLPSEKKLINPPVLTLCAMTSVAVPDNCLSVCQVTKLKALTHLLVRSEISGRLGLPEHAAVCSVSHKNVLSDELEESSVSHKLVLKDLLKTSAVSHKKAEAEYFTTCDFTNNTVLIDEIATSQISGKKFRLDQGQASEWTNKKGHCSEFVYCPVSFKNIAVDETELCAVTGIAVRKGLLEKCEVTQQAVVPSELGRCMVTGKRAINSLLVSNGVSFGQLLESAAVRSHGGKFCAPIEAIHCQWSGTATHPDDIRECALTALSIHFSFATRSGRPTLQRLVELLEGTARGTDQTVLWATIEPHITKAIGKGRCDIKAASLSPDKKSLAVCAEVKTFLGLRVQHTGLVYSLTDREVIGHCAIGRRSTASWHRITA